MEEVTVILVLRSGGDFAFKDVQLITYHLRKQWKGDQGSLRIICLYDKVSQPFPLVGLTLLPMETAWRGWWSKMNVFAPELEEFRPFLYLDLDTAVVGDIKHLIPRKNISDFVCLCDFYRSGVLASGVMQIPAQSLKISKIWNHWILNPGGYMKKFRGDQDFIRSVANADLFWQDIVDDRICTFKPWKKGWVHKVPDKTSLVCFHGKPRIWQAAKKVKWVDNYINVNYEE